MRRISGRPFALVTSDNGIRRGWNRTHGDVSGPANRPPVRSGPRDVLTGRVIFGKQYVTVQDAVLDQFQVC